MSAFETSKKIVIGDVAHDAADAGSPIKLGGKASVAAPTAVSTGDRVNAWFDLNGRLVVNVGGISGMTNSEMQVGGVQAHDEADSGNPVKVGGKASLTTPAAVAAGDRVNAYFDPYGRLVVMLDSQTTTVLNTTGKITEISHRPTNEYGAVNPQTSFSASTYCYGFQNPAGSGKTYLIDRLIISSIAAADITLHLATAYTATAFSLASANMRRGGGSSTAKYTTAPTGLTSAAFWRGPVYANERVEIVLNGALALSAGELITAYKTTGDTGQWWMTIFWREETA